MTGDDDFDKRFRELIADEFGVDPEPEPFSFDEAMDRVDGNPDPWDEFEPEDPGPLPRPKNLLVGLGISLVVMAVVWGLLSLAIPAPIILTRVAGILGVAGLAILIFSVPRQRNDADDGGIRL